MNLLPHPAVAPSANRPELADDDVVTRVLAGETELFELLMRRHNRTVFRSLRAFAGRETDLEDVVQEAWVRAFHHLKSFRGEASFRTWLVTICRHEAMSRARRSARFEALPSDDRLVAPRTGDPMFRAENEELRRLLESAIDLLSPALKTVLVLRDVEGLSTEETARALDISQEAVKVRLHRGRAAVRGRIERGLGDALPELFAFAGDRCDLVVEGVLERLRLAG